MSMVPIPITFYINYIDVLVGAIVIWVPPCVLLRDVMGMITMASIIIRCAHV